MTAVVWPKEPVRPAGALPDDPLVVLVRAHYETLTHNIVASASEKHRVNVWLLTGFSGYCTWEEIPEKLASLRPSLFRIDVFLLQPTGWPL